MRHSHKHNRIWWTTIPKMLSKSTKLNNIPAWKDVERKSLEWKISTLVTHLVRHRDLADRETDGAVHWSSLCLKLRRAFQSEGAQTFSDSQWLDVLLYLRSIQGHSGGELITWTDESCRQSTQMERIPVSYGSSFNVNSILRAGLIASGKGTEEVRQTVFFTQTLLGMTKKNSTTIYSREKCTHCKSTWKVSQDAVYWINWWNAQEKGLQLWQKWSRAIILHDSVPADCIEKVVCLQGDKTVYQRIPTPRPAPKIVLKHAWQVEKRHTVKQRAVVCGGRPLQHWSLCSRSTIKSSTRKDDQDSRIGEQAQNAIPKRICHCRLE